VTLRRSIELVKPEAGITLKLCRLLLFERRLVRFLKRHKTERIVDL